MKVSQDPRWPTAHIKLRELYEARTPKGMTQADFGATYGLGTQGLVWQYLNGYTPLNIEAAAKFATGLGCKIADISPEMASFLQRELLPVLGKKMLKAALSKAAVLVVFSIPPLLPQKADAAICHNVPIVRQVSDLTTHCVAMLQRIVGWLFAKAFSFSDSAITAV